MEKKGSHIGLVLSFVIFITFIIFLYVIVQPTIKLDEKQNTLELIENEIIEKSSADLTSASVSITSQQTCVELRDFFSKTGINSDRVIVRNDAGDVLTASKIGSSLFVIGNIESFFKVHESVEFAIASGNPTNPCPPLNEGNGYNLGLVKTNKQIFETKIIKLINDYDADYELFKEEIGVGLGDEFGFGFKDNNQMLVETEEKNVSVSVYANEIPIQYISESAALEPGFLSVKAW